MEDLEDDGWLGNEPDDTHPLAATAKKRVDLVTIAITAVLQAMDTFPADRLYQILNAIFDNKAELAAVWKGANAPPPRVSPRDVDDLYHTGGAFDARGLSRPYQRIVYRIGEIGDPKLQLQNRTVSFKQAAGFGGRVVLTATRPALHEILWFRFTGGGGGRSLGSPPEFQI